MPRHLNKFFQEVVDDAFMQIRVERELEKLAEEKAYEGFQDEAVPVAMKPRTVVPIGRYEFDCYKRQLSDANAHYYRFGYL